MVIISLDGLRPDALEQADTPILDDLRTKGAYSPSAKTILPSVTLVSHASMLGGMTPAKHGIFENEDKLSVGFINGPTLFSIAHDAGLSTGMVVGKPKLSHLVLTDSVDIYNYAGPLDRLVVNQAIKIIQAGLPNILFIHLPDIDSAGHAFGWMSQAQLIDIGHTDALIGEIITALNEGNTLSQTVLIITADHGGHARTHGTNSLEDMTIPWLAVGPTIRTNVILTRPITIYDTAATALYILKLSQPSAWDGQPVLEIFKN